MITGVLRRGKVASNQHTSSHKVCCSSRGRGSDPYEDEQEKLDSTKVVCYTTAGFYVTASRYPVGLAFRCRAGVLEVYTVWKNRHSMPAQS